HRPAPSISYRAISSIMTPPPPSSTLFPYTTLFRSSRGDKSGRHRGESDEECKGAVSHAQPTPARRTQAPQGPATTEPVRDRRRGDRKSTRLNSSHRTISYAVFCLKKKRKRITTAAS